jgi:transposase
MSVMLALILPRVYYLDMASLIGKKQGGKTYYYLAESARVNGKPRIVSQRYLGSAEEIAERLSGAGPGEPTRTQHRGFGDLAAVWGVLERLGVAQIVDEVVGARRADAGASVGTYLALAAANRVVAPCSKLGFADWWATTAGDRLVRLRAGALDHRRFWNAMDAIDADQLVEIERRVSAAAISSFGLDCRGLVLDMTNFATYIDSANERAPIAQRGHAKQKRNDLRLVGLGLVITTDGGIPLVSHPYAGNRPDVTQFAQVVRELAARYGTIATEGDQLTLVYDAGQDSAANQTIIEATPLHFVGSLRPSDHADLLAQPRSRYKVVDAERFPGLSAFEAKTIALGQERRVVVTHSDELHDKMRRGFAQTMAKAHRQLSELAARLERGKTRRSKAAVETEVSEITSARWVSRCMTVTLRGTTASSLRLEFAVDRAAQASLEAEVFGKRILFTDHVDWSIADVVGAYRSQWQVEADFRQMKDPSVVSFSPMFHWTEQKIRVHVFYCVLALTVARLIVRQAEQSGLHLSVRELLAHLAGIEETVLLFANERGRPRARHMLTDMDPIQRRLYDLFELETYAPKR